MKMTEAVAPYNDSDPLEYIKNPMIAEFMGFRKDTKFDESQLEQALIEKIVIAKIGMNTIKVLIK